MKITKLVTSIGEFQINESVKKIKEILASIRDNTDSAEDYITNDLHFNMVNTNGTGELYECSIPLSKYMMVREVEKVEKKEEV